MRLLQVDENGDFNLTGDLTVNIPPYAILSHTWGDDRDEVNFNDLTIGPKTIKAGYKKLQFCAEQCTHDGLKYFWVDTCCIDKSNSTELSRAINSMFRWYQNAERCYVYLSDVSIYSRDGRYLHIDSESAIRNSRWFKRGWTLQELLAPKIVEFFSRDLIRLGDKHSLEQRIVDITGIPFEALRGRSLSEFSIEERFCWAERRQTTMEEDKAYCLLGIFGVFLPLIYGEGQSNAMRRIRKEIRESISTELQSSAPGRQIDTIVPSKMEEIYIGVMGSSGSGKSTFIKLLTGHDVPVGNGSNSCTDDIVSYSYVYEQRLRVHMIDTPGFDHVMISDVDVLVKIAKYLSHAYEKGIRLSGMIYLCPDGLLRKSDQHGLVLFQKLCGHDSLSNVVFANTFRDVAKPHTRSAPNEELIKTKDLLGSMLSHGSAIMFHSGSRHSAKVILEWVLRNRRPLVLQLQKELLIERLALKDTEAGRELDERLLRQRRQFEQEVKDLQDKMAQTLRNSH